MPSNGSEEYIIGACHVVCQPGQLVVGHTYRITEADDVYWDVEDVTVAKDEDAPQPAAATSFVVYGTNESKALLTGTVLYIHSVDAEELRVSQEYCAFCTHWTFDGNGPEPRRTESPNVLQYRHGDCRALPPVRGQWKIITSGETHQAREWPITRGHEGCGAFVKRTKG